MNVDLAQELLNELGSSLEKLETQHAALLQFLKDNGMVTDDQFAPYLTQAAKASNVRWRAAHIRLERLFEAEREKEEKLREKDKHQAAAGQVPIQNQEKETKPGNDKAGSHAAPKGESTSANGAAAAPVEQPAADKNNKQDQPQPSADKTPTQP